MDRIIYYRVILVACFAILLSGTGIVTGQQSISRKEQKAVEAFFVKKYSGTPVLKGADATIPSLAVNYCSNEGYAELVPDSWHPSAASIEWTITTFVGSEETHTLVWGEYVGTGQNTVFRFYPNKVTTGYFNQDIYLSYVQKNGVGLPIGSANTDRTKVYLFPTQFDFGSDVSICDGETAELTLENSETGMEYQLLDGASNPVGFPIAGIDGTAIKFNVTAASTYSVDAVNVAGKAVGKTCSVSMDGTATVTVNSNPTATALNDSPVCEGGDVNFAGSGGAGGTGPYTFSWNGPGGYSSSDQEPFISGITIAGVGTYTLEVTDANLCKATDDTEVTLKNSTNITGQPVSQDVCPGTDVTFTVTAEGTNLSYQWKKGGADIIGETGTSLALLNVSAADEADYTVEVGGDCGTITSNIAALTLKTNTSITVQPVSQDVCPGSDVTYTVTAIGENLSYQWKKDGVDITGQTGASLALLSVSAGDEADYIVEVSGDCGGSVTSNIAALSLKTNTSITVHPASQDVCPGSNVTFTVTAEGTNLSYQWKKDGADIPGETGTSLNLLNVSGANEGDYSVEISGDCGIVTSNVAVLSLKTNTSITVQPTSQDVCPGSDVTFTVTAIGENLIYQWKKDGADIVGETGVSLFLLNVSAANEGDYTVEVSGDCGGSVTSNMAALSLKTNTSITVHPASQDVCPGSNVTFTVSAEGTNLSYQWKKDGTDLAGATGASLNLLNVSTANEGDYTVEVSGDCGTETSNIAALSLQTNTSITLHPISQDVCPGSDVTFTVTAIGENLTYQWKKGGIDIAGETGASLSLLNVSAANEGDYTVEVSGDCGGAVTSNIAALSLKMNTNITVQPASQDVCTGSNVTFTVTAEGTNLSFQWKKDGLDIVGETSASLILLNVSAANEGDYTVEVSGDCGIVNSNIAALTLKANTNITLQPVSQDVCPGSDVTFTLTAIGENLTYQWKKGGIDIAGETGASLGLLNVSAVNEGDYTVEVTGDCGTETSNIAALSLKANTNITVQPTSQDVCSGNNVTFIVTAEGTNLSYQWRKDGVDIAGETNASLNLSNVSTADEGDYTVEVDGDCGTLTSVTATLTVNDRPTGTISGTQAICQGESANLEIDLSGTAPWTITYNDGTSDNTVVTNDDPYTLAVSPGSDATYNLVALTDANCSAQGSDMTGSAIVTVNRVTSGISITAPVPGGATICAGTAVTFNASGADGSGNYNYDFHLVRATVDNSVQSGASVTYTTSTLQDGDEIYVIVTDNTTGCVDQSVSIVMTVNANPVVTLNITSPGGNTVCNGSTVDFEATSGYGNYVFYVNGVDVQNGASDTYSTNTLVTGDAIYVLASSGVGCSAASAPVITMTVNDLPTASLTSDQPADVACENETVTFIAGGGDNYEFFVDAVSQGAASPVNTFQHSSVNDFTVSVRVIDGNNCEDTEAVAITISKPVAGLMATATEICDGQSVTFTATGGAQYEFFKDAISVQGPNASDTYVDAGLIDGQVVTVKVIDVAGCEDTHGGITMTVNANPTATLTSSDADHIICEGESVTFTGSGSDTYHFFVNGISVQGPSTTDTYTTTALVNNDEVSVLVINSTTTCSTLSSTLQYTVNSNPNATLSANPAGNIIAGTSVTFTAGGGTDYEFFVNGISVQALGNGNTYTTNALVNGDVVAVNVHTAAGCISTETLMMTVLDGIQLFDVLSSGVDHCQGDVSSVSIYIATPQNGVTYDLMRTSDDGVVGTITHDGTNAVQWDNIPGTEEYRIEAYYLTVPADRLEMNNRITVTENPLPSVYQINPYNGSETGCNGGAGWVIGVADSDNSINYNLLLNGALVETVAGDGNPISFSAQSVIGVYTVQAVTASGCTILMDGNFTINGDGSDVPFNVYSLPADGRYCAGDVGIEIRLDGSLDNTVNYVVYKDGVDTGVSVPGNSGDISLGFFTADGMYTVRVLSGSGCEFPMNGSVDVQTIALPVTHNLEATNGGHYCFGDGTGLQIWLSGQELGVEYQLYLGGIAQGAPITGAVTDIATPLFFPGAFLTTGTYSVTATKPGVGCQSPMNNTLDIVVDPLPFAFDVTSDGDYCTGSVTYLRLNGSEADVEYRWEREGDAVTGPWTDGTGGLLSFEITGTDTYYIVGRKKDGVTSCSSEMKGRFAIAEKPYADLTKLLTVKAGTGTDCSTGAIVIVENSEAGVVYELVKGGVRTGNVVTGDGTDVEFPNAIVDIAATYNAYASLSGCEDLLTDDVLINVPGAINQYSVTGAGDICNGDPGQQFGLSSTEAGVTYKLYLADAPGSATGTEKGSLVGDGLAQLFPLVNEEGEYFVIGDNGVDCAIEMLNRVTLTVNPLPVAFKMIGSGFFCDPLDGAEIGIDNSEVGVSYTLQYDDGTGLINRATAIGVAGGDTIIFGKYTDIGTYEVVAITDKGCTSSMNGEVLVQQVASPTDYQVDSDDTNYCDDQTGVELRMEHSETGVVYEVFDITNKLIVSVTGDGSDNLVLGTVTAGTYNVYGSYGGDACQTAMHGGTAIVITELTRPAKFNVTVDALDVCGTVGTALRIDGSEVDILYQLYIAGVHEPSADIIGTGNPLEWNVISATSGIINYEIRAISGGTCDLTMGTVDVNYKDAPTIPVVLTPDGSSYCDFNAGVRVGIEASVAGVGYQLIETGGGTSVSFIQGDGSDKYFTGLVSGTTEYIVEARDNSSGCINNSTAFTITASTSANSYAVTSDVTNTCTSNNVILSLGGSDIGVDYELNTDGVPSGTLIPGTGSSLTWSVTEPVDGSVIYEVIANPGQACELSMGTIEVTYKLSPTTFNIVSDGGNTEYCADEPGIRLGLDGSQNNIGYRLYNLANEVVDYKTGDGNSFYFINIHATGTYRVDAIDFGAGCVSNMIGSITLVENTLPRKDIEMEPNNGPASVTEITLTTTEDGIRYQLMKDGVDYGASVDAPGSSAGISFGTPTSMGVYTVRATNMTTGCMSVLADQTILDSQNIEEKKFESAKPTVDDPYCPSENRTIRLYSSQPDVVYTLIRDGVKLSGKTGVGNGNDIEIIDDTPLDDNRANGMLIYGIFAEFPGTSISKTFTETIRIFAWPSKFDAIQDTLRINPGFTEGAIDLAQNDLPSLSFYVDPVNNDYNYAWAVVYDFIKKAPDANDNEPYFGDVSLASDGTILSYTKRPDFNSIDSVSYYINLLGCGPTFNDTASVLVIVGNESINEQAILIPNAITPNGDGMNEYFEIVGIEKLSSSKLEVFNRWGTLVYRSKGQTYENDWDGSGSEASMVTLGDKLPSGTYFYVFTVTVIGAEGKEVNQEYNGYIELRR